MSDADLVTIVIPAYNAAGTIDETLRSVRSQTHTQLEILVIDDGSHDITPNIVLDHAASDCRVRLIRQKNSGVAAARNRGIAEARAKLIAPVDADDLWRCDKIEKQLVALREGGDRVALVYTWLAVIDENSVIVHQDHHPIESGAVLRPLFGGNFIGNGSATLIRKSAILEAGGYDTSLRERDAQGAEDYQLYLNIAERHLFALVPEYLTGYRRTATNMSSDVLQMLRSWEFVMAKMITRYPEFSSEYKAGRDDYMRMLFAQALHARRTHDVLHLAANIARHSSVGALRTVLLETFRQIIANRTRRARNFAKSLFGRDVATPSIKFVTGSPAHRT